MTKEENNMSVKAIKEVSKTEDKKLSNAEAIEDLKQQVIHYNQMLLKAQGALEVLLMLENPVTDNS